MYFGLESISDFPFVSVGFLFVMTGALGYGATYALGLTRGGRAALKFSRLWTLWTAATLGATVLYAVLSTQWSLFIREFGYGPLIEMAVLAVGFLLIMWFMATQYARGRIDLDERFGKRNENYRA
ncbi:MAG: hypothetical protein FWD41_01890 [Actinomycetia bacterium]|nr:hypothetical protein [Actinomycetes bacterium]